MPQVSPLPDWEDEDVYLIGGGLSLRGFDFGRLHGRCTIGCNQAFTLGADACNVCVFGDWKFWTHFRTELEAYEGWIATNYVGINPRPEWLNAYARADEGLVRGGGVLAWNANSGALAINLALQMGARRVFLLGYDLHAPKVDGQVASHWHDRRISVPKDTTYPRFSEGFQSVARALPKVFPGREIINVTDGSSRLEAFPRVHPREVFP